MFSCARRKALTQDAGNPTLRTEAINDSTIKFTLLQLNDVYEIAPLEKGKVGGMARIGTIRKRLLAETPNLLTVMAGDFLSPSLLGTMKFGNSLVKGRQMVEVMNAVGFDLVVFGNHEFDLKEDELQQRINESSFAWISTNIMNRKKDIIQPFFKETTGSNSFFPETHYWTIQDNSKGLSAKVGFYGVCLADNQQPYVYYEDPFIEAGKAYREIRESADIILGLTHLELAQDLKMASLLPETVLIMGGHEHENSYDKVGNTAIAKADANAKTAYIHRFTYNLKTKEITLSSELMKVTDAIPDDPAVSSIVTRWNNYQRQQISTITSNPDEVIYKASEPLDGLEKSVRNFQTNLGNLIAAGFVYAASQPADGAFFNGGSIRVDDKLMGDITPVDIFRALPFGGSLFEVEMKGSLLVKILSAGVENKGKGGYLQWHNINYDEQGRKWQINKQQIDTDKVYRLMTNDYVFAGKEARLEFLNKNNPDIVKWSTAADNDASDLRSDVRRAVIAYLKSIKN
jgi:2',3'-cyclic-nucleotide 2'-phosphodiesterase (5'-nucleotidase family)